MSTRGFGVGWVRSGRRSDGVLVISFGVQPNRPKTCAQRGIS